MKADSTDDGTAEHRRPCHRTRCLGKRGNSFRAGNPFSTRPSTCLVVRQILGDAGSLIHYSFRFNNFWESS